MLPIQLIYKPFWKKPLEKKCFKTLFIIILQPLEKKQMHDWNNILPIPSFFFPRQLLLLPLLSSQNGINRNSHTIVYVNVF